MRGARRAYKGLPRKRPIIISFVGKLIFVTSLKSQASKKEINIYTVVSFPRKGILVQLN